MSLIQHSITSTEIITWVMDHVVSELVIAFILVVVSYIFISPIRVFDNIRDKKRIYKWLYNKTKKYNGLKFGIIDGCVLDTRTDPKWCRTNDIASSNGLTVDRTKELCYKHKKIELMATKDIMSDRNKTDDLEERWAIKEFVRR